MIIVYIYTYTHINVRGKVIFEVYILERLKNKIPINSATSLFCMKR